MVTLSDGHQVRIGDWVNLRSDARARHNWRYCRAAGGPVPTAPGQVTNVRTGTDGNGRPWVTLTIRWNKRLVTLAPEKLTRAETQDDCGRELQNQKKENHV